MAQRKLTSTEAKFLQEALAADYINSNIRLREGEYQYNLAKAVSSFELELQFPDVRDIIKVMFGEEKVNDIQFVRKIQTILKKMEKSNIVKILPKKNPWDLQRYGLTSFKFQDVDRNLVVLAGEEQVKQTKNMLSIWLTQQAPVPDRLRIVKTLILLIVLGASYVTSVWSLLQPIINPVIFISAFSVAAVCSVMLGKVLAKK